MSASEASSDSSATRAPPIMPVTSSSTSPVTVLSRLKDKVRRQCLVSKDRDGLKYFPANLIESFAPEDTEAAITHEVELDATAESLSQLVQYVHDPRQPAKRLFLALLMIDSVSTLKSFYRSEFCDRDLPVHHESCYRKGDGGHQSHYYVVSTPSESKEWSFFSSWSENNVEAFERAQWMFLAPVFTRDKFEYPINQDYPLPITWKAPEPKYGYSSSVYEVEMHEAHQQVLSNVSSDLS